jgi:DNA-binding transcriptional regulator LsrR (DeoR family)
MMHMVAKLHYQSDMAQVDIAKKLGVSTATISRLLNKARAAGIVRIEVVELTSPEEITADLIQRLGLNHAAVVEAPPSNVLGSLATPLAGLL